MTITPTVTSWNFGYGYGTGDLGLFEVKTEFVKNRCQALKCGRDRRSLTYVEEPEALLHISEKGI